MFVSYSFKMHIINYTRVVAFLDTVCELNEHLMRVYALNVSRAKH
jgi:hypothetical protein